MSRRLITASIWKGGLVLDLFNGSGTTGIVARELGRKFVGIDMVEEYLELTLRRVRHLE